MSVTKFQRPGAHLSLTPQELRILSLLASGFTLAQTAKLAGISQCTVKYHLKKLFSKLGARGRANAVAIATSHGLMPAEATQHRMHGNQPSLTPAQLRVIGLMASGCTIKQIAEQAGISVYTVKFHLKYAYFKLGAYGRSHAVAIAAALGLLPPSAILASRLAAGWIACETSKNKSDAYREDEVMYDENASVEARRAIHVGAADTRGPH